jgi:DNA-binding LytR/AlgR family response regulator
MDHEKKKVDPALRVATVAVVLGAAGVLIAASGRHAYSYYSVLRWLACSAAVILAWRGAVQGFKWAWALVPLAILFNPIAPIHLSRATWQILDIAAAVVMVLAAAIMEMGTLLGRKQ